MTDCNIIYSDLINNYKIHNYEDLNIVCTNNFDSCENIYDDKDVCCKSLKKLNKEKYYIHEYNREWVYDLLKNNSDMTDEMINKIFDLEKKSECCNCISIVLYSKNDIKNLYDYLYSMKKSLDNVSNNLKGFIVRFYLDVSVFKTIYNEYIKYKDDIDNKDNDNLKYLSKSFEILKYIINHDISEIYIYFCKEIINNDNLEKIRIFRFLPLIENDVNIIIIRDADGFVSYSDCHNIKLFSREEEHKILMAYDYINNLYLDNESNVKNIHYNSWLNLFDIINDIYMFCKNENSLILNYIIDNLKNERYNPITNLEELCDNKNNEEFKFNLINKINFSDYYNNRNKYNKDKIKIDLLAGIFASKVRLNKQYYMDVTKSINDVIEFYVYNNNKFDENIDSFIKNEIIKDSNKPLNILKTGFDEILLNKIYYFLIVLNSESFKEVILTIPNIGNFDLNIFSKIFDKDNNDKFMLDTDLIQETYDYDKYDLTKYWYDFIFSNNYKIKDSKNYGENKYININNKLLNEKFENSITLDKTYSMIYPEKKLIDDNTSYFNKYLKYKKKYIKLKTLKYKV